MGGRAVGTADLNAGSFAVRLSLRNKSRNVDVCLLPLGSSLDVRLPARADSRLLVSGPPPVSVPPMSSPAMERASRTPDPTSIAHRYLKTRRPQPANTFLSLLTASARRSDWPDRPPTATSRREHRWPRPR